MVGQDTVVLMRLWTPEELRKRNLHDLNAIITVDTNARVRGTQIDTNSWRHCDCVWWLRNVDGCSWVEMQRDGVSQENGGRECKMEMQSLDGKEKMMGKEEIGRDLWTLLVVV